MLATKVKARRRLLRGIDGVVLIRQTRVQAFVYVMCQAQPMAKKAQCIGVALRTRRFESGALCALRHSPSLHGVLCAGAATGLLRAQRLLDARFNY